MSFNTLSYSQHRPNSLSQSALTRPNVTFNYVSSKTNTSVINLHHNRNKFQSLNRSLNPNINYPNQQALEKTEKIKKGNKPLSHYDHKRTKIFAKSVSNYLENLSCGNSTQNYREFCENRQPSDMIQIKSKSSRRRNNIFQSYNPKSRVQSTKPQILKNETYKVITSLAFDRPVHPKKLTSYIQLSPNRISKIINESSPVIKLSAQKQIKKIPLRDTYIAQRDYDEKIVSQNKQEPKNILQKELYEIQMRKYDKSFNKKLEIGQFFIKSKNTNFNHLQFEQESIIGYSQQQSYPYDEKIQDLPQLFLETNEKIMAKTQKCYQSKSKKEIQSLVDIKLQTTVVSEKSQGFSKMTRNTEQPLQEVQIISNKQTFQNIPYVLVILGVLLFLIQLLK